MQSGNGPNDDAIQMNAKYFVTVSERHKCERKNEFYLSYANMEFQSCFRLLGVNMD